MPDPFFPSFNILSYTTVESTNTLALQRLKNGEAKHGDVILSQYQSRGKGQAQSSWFSTEGKNILISIVCKDLQLKARDLPKINMLLSLAIFRLTNQFFPGKASIKWPNDILVNDQKIAGILIETALMGEFISHAVMGIGLNVNEASFPDDLTSACSFYTLTKQETNLNNILQLLLEETNHTFSNGLNKSFQDLKQEYERVLFGINAKSRFQTAENYFEGTITGVNEYGQLCVETPSGPETFNNKEISLDLAKH